MPSPIHAILVGVNKYQNEDFGTLSSAVRDATTLKECFLELGANEAHMQLLKDEEATKKRIKEAIESLPDKVERNSPIVFFYSGFAGKAGETGIICAHDAGVSEDGGYFTDQELQQLFEKVSRSCGNNITLFLDCSANDYEWNNPTSMVVVAPNRAWETTSGAAFTNALVEILKRHKDNLDELTVECFIGHAQAEITDEEIVIQATGSNINRPLFNMKAAKSIHTFIPCHTSRDGRIMLSAGAAHGVRAGAVYGIYRSNLRSTINNRIGDLKVDSPNDLTAIFEESALKIPKFFYACEEDNYFDPIPIFCASQVDLGSSAPWKPELDVTKAPIVATAKPPGFIIVKRPATVAFCWTGLHGANVSDFWPSLKLDQIDKLIDASDLPALKLFISRAARFYHLLTLPAPLLNPLSSKLRITFEETESDGKNLFENDHFEPHKTLSLNYLLSSTIGPYHITLANNHNHAVWVNILFFNSEELEIEERYTPGSFKARLEAGGKLVIGRNDKRAIMLHNRPRRQFDIWYMKVIITKEKSDFTFLQQSHWSADLEAELRGYKTLKAIEQKDQMEDRLAQTAVSDSELEEDRDKESGVSYWTSMLITVVEEFSTRRGLWG